MGNRISFNIYPSAGKCCLLTSTCTQLVACAPLSSHDIKQVVSMPDWYWRGEQHSHSLTEMGGGWRNFSAAHPNSEPVSTSTAMGQKVSSMQCRHRLLLGYSCSISFCQAYMYIDVYAPTLNGCCMPWCVLQSLTSKSDANVDLWFPSGLYTQISFSQQPWITEFLGDVCLFLDRLEQGLKPEVLSQLEYPEQLEAVLMPLPVGTKQSN